MPRVSILSREETAIFAAPGQVQSLVVVLYATEAIPARIISLPPAAYRPASIEELKAQPRYKVYPLDDAAAQAERLAIGQDLQRALAGPPESFDTL